ncbi:hypothetical protein LEMLEM_LOCUS14195 [Lemmus lemmus]
MAARRVLRARLTHHSPPTNRLNRPSAAHQSTGLTNPPTNRLNRPSAALQSTGLTNPLTYTLK